VHALHLYKAEGILRLGIKGQKSRETKEQLKSIAKIFLNGVSKTVLNYQSRGPQPLRNFEYFSSEKAQQIVNVLM